MQTAAAATKTPIEKTGAVLLEGGPDYKALLKKYTELPHDGIALVVANAFMRAEHNELCAVFNLCAC